MINYADIIITGVKANLEKIDAAINGVSQNWKTSRMTIVDRNILRMAVFEIRLMPEPLKPNIAINEAIELAKRYGTTDSSGFVNGLLDQIAKEN